TMLADGSALSLTRGADHRVFPEMRLGVFPSPLLEVSRNCHADGCPGWYDASSGRGLPMLARIGAGSPSNDEVHAALDRVIASDVLQGSPQLIAFLRFVVEATLRGDGDQIKAYTIAVEALGRGEDFDPYIDPIVRVDAGRLRRALERYYAGVGATDTILIHIPRGHY